jgi:hypothetical protein
VEDHLQVLLVISQHAVFQGLGPGYQEGGEDEIVLPTLAGN